MNAHDEHAKAAKLFYAYFPSQFVWLAQSKTWKIRQRDEVIGRLVAVHPNQGDPKELFLKFEEDLAHDYVAVQHLTKDQARQQLLQVLNLELQSMGKSLADFDLLSLLAQHIPRKYSFSTVQISSSHQFYLPIQTNPTVQFSPLFTYKPMASS
ncbi:hypothetical protein RHGRI_013443 [Rhododendron griersonianum]|uniref:Uncharacterized protein n=1 Tax=Rhododendron griersonianum TaxID=479676 RepID=A0AAV6K5M4_9ERIC|nr:hypothetical protein RHGRI_013443 [Rhododendron griersonianum]